MKRQKFLLQAASRFLASSMRWYGGSPVLRKCAISVIQPSSKSEARGVVSMDNRDASGRSPYSYSGGSIDSKWLR